MRVNFPGSVFLTVALSLSFISVAAAENRVVNVENHRTVGGQTVSDRQAVDAAVSEAIQLSASYNVTLNFQPNRVYRLLRNRTDAVPDPIFPFVGVKNIVVNGQGAQLVLDRYDYVAEIRDSENVHIWNMKMDYAVPNHTQGTVVEVNTAGAFLVDIDAGYLMPYRENPAHDWANSLAFNSQAQFLRNINIFIQDVQTVAARRVRIIPKAGYENEAKKLQPGFRFALRAFAEGGKANFMIRNNLNVSIKDVDIYNTMKMAFTAHYNRGNLVFDKVRIMRKPGTNRLVAGLSDGFHIKSNRAIVQIKNSLIERIMDDGINLGSMAEVCHNYYPSSLDVDLRDTAYIGPDSPGSVPLQAGDTVQAFQFGANATRIFLGSATITQVTPLTNKTRRVRLSAPIPGLVCLDPGTTEGVGGKNLQQWHATRFFVPQISNPGFRVLNNVIREKARNGILGKGMGTLVKGNVFENMSGAGVDATNNLMFNEGPVPLRMEVAGNTFRDIQLNSVIMGISSYSTANLPTMDINSDIVNNEFVGGTPMRFLNAGQVNVAGNIFSGTTTTVPVVKNVPTLTARPVTSLFQLPGNAGFFFEGPGYACRYDSPQAVVNVWGPNYAQLVSQRPHFPPARFLVDACRVNEGISRLASGGIIRIDRVAEAPCNWGSVKRLQLGTGIATPGLLGIVDPGAPPSVGVCTF